MGILENITNIAFDFFLKNKNLYIFLFLILPICLQISLGIFKKNKIIFLLSSSLSFLFLISDFSLDLFLFKMGMIDIYLLILVAISIVLQNIISLTEFSNSNKSYFFRFKSIYVRKMVINELMSYLIGIYALLSISFFDEIKFVKYGLMFSYLFFFLHNLKSISIHNNYINQYLDVETGMKIVLTYPGSRMNSLPFNVLLNIKLFWIFALTSIVLKIEKSKINRGIFDVSNRASLLVLNSDNQWHGALYLISCTI